MLHRVVAILVLAFVCSGAWATDYVFSYNNGYLANDNGTIKYVTTFDPSTCIWTCYNGTTETSLSSNSSYSLKNGNYYLTGSTTNGNAPGLSTNASNSWRSDGTRLYYRSSGTSYYLYYRDTKWRTSNTEGWNGNNTSYRGGYSSYTDYRATATASTTSNAKDNTTAPAISIEGLNGSSGIQLSRTDIGGTYTPEATTIAVGKTTYYKQTDGTYSTTAPSAELSPSYAWSVPSGSATVSSTGVLTLSNNNTQNVTVRLTTTYAGNKTKTTDLKISATSVSALNDQSTPDITITPASATIDLSGSQTFSVPATISQTTITRDAYVEIKSGSQTYYKVGNTYQTTQPEEVETPGNPISFSSATWTLTENDGYLTNSGLSGQTVTLTRDNTKKVGDNKTVTISVSASYDTNSKSATAIAKIPFTYIDLTALTAGDAINMGIGSTTSINGHFSYTPSDNSNGRPYTSFTYTSANTSVATVDSNGKITAVAPGTTTITVQSKKINGENGPSCTVTVNVSLVAPAISIDNDGYVTITDNNAAGSGVSIRYTVDGSTPTSTAGTAYNSKFGPVDNLTVVKAVAYKGTTLSAVASQQYIKSGVIPGTGALGGTVILNDYEDHSWTYYQSNDKLPAGYPATYLNSPDPRNVKITYRAYDVEGNKIILGGTATNVGTNNALIPAISGLMSGSNYTEPENVMIYYKTLEKHDLSVKDDGEYAYTVISNPFSKRPKSGDKYYGFAGWKIISGGEFISEYSNEQILPLDKTIHFTNLDNGYTPNCTSAEVVFEATWKEATVKKLTSTTVPTFDEGDYETNFLLLGANMTGAITIPSSCTLMARNPDGTVGNYNNYYTYGVAAGTNNVKLEHIQMNLGFYTNAYIKAEGYNFTIGRGVNNTLKDTPDDLGGFVYGLSSNKSSDNTFKIESGQYYLVVNFGNISTSILNGITVSSDNAIDQLMVLGCDYDRAKNDNNQLTIFSNILTGNFSNTTDALNRSSGNLYVRYDVKSGNLCSEINVKGNNEYSGGINYNFYTSIGGQYQRGRRFFLMEGGRVSGIAGGQDADDSQKTTDRAVDMRIRGTAQIDGNVYGAAEYAGGRGIRTMIFTGGNINGWIAGGANGTQSTGGLLEGSTYVYVGGNTTVKSDASYPNQVMNRAVGGNVFGAGCGYSATSTSGKVTAGTNVVVSDGAYIERGVYGGGSYGFCANDKTSSLFILGGTVAGKSGGVNGANYDSSVQGGVYGGACQNIGGSANIYMDGGVVETGLYGGSNKTGTLSGSVTMQINGGQVGTTSSAANIHGGGYGQSTQVSKNVDITLGKTGSEADAGGVTVYGDVYGGSALGSVNGTNAADTYHTNVTLNAGTIHGSLYGGALGSKKGVNGATSDVAANVYGPVTVTVNGGKVVGDNSAVYGCNNINGAPQKAVSVIVNGTDSHNNNGTANDFSDDTYAINAVYGGGNQAAYIYGIPTVTVNNCDNSIGYVYGGGNQATVPATSVTIHGGNVIGNVFGGGNNAAVTGTGVADNNKGTRVNIDGGRILNVYGGNNNGGAITGTIKVDVAESAEGCGVNIDDLYGGGNLAASNAGQITIGKCTNINRVFGGANQANVTGPINLSIVNGNIGTVFGGNNNSGTITGNITVTVNWDGTGNRSLGSVYGGGNLAEYKGNPTVNIQNGALTGNVFGGGLGATAVVVGNPAVNVGDWNSAHSVEIGGDVFGGGDLAAVEGNPTVTIRDCGTLIEGNLYGGGNAAPVYSTNTTMWGGTVMGNVFGGGNGADATKNAKGAQVGYKRDDETKAPSGVVEEGKVDVGDAVTCIYGGTIGTWEVVDGVKTCTSGGGIFGASNTNGNIAGEVKLTLDQQKCTETGAEECKLVLKEVYGSGNEAAYAGTGIVFNLGCVDALDEIYGGAKNADMKGDIHLKITSGHFRRVFGGNNLGGSINGSIKVTVDETGCYPVTIDELYGCGNNAAYTTPSGKDDPVVNIVSCTSVGKVFGGGYGSAATVTGNPTVNINMIPGKFVPGTQDETNTTELGTVGEVYGGGNAAKVVGNTSVNIGTLAKVKRADETKTDADVQGANILGNVYGGGNAADVTGKTNVQIGKAGATSSGE